MARAPRVDRTPAAPAPHHGWLAGSPKTAWKDWEDCTADDLWAEEVMPGKFRRKIIKVECQHKRQGHRARAIVRGEDAYLDEVYATGLIVPCQHTKCPYWINRNEGR